MTKFSEEGILHILKDTLNVKCPRVCFLGRRPLSTILEGLKGKNIRITIEEIEDV